MESVSRRWKMPFVSNVSWESVSLDSMTNSKNPFESWQTRWLKRFGNSTIGSQCGQLIVCATRNPLISTDYACSVDAVPFQFRFKVAVIRIVQLRRVLVEECPFGGHCEESHHIKSWRRPSRHLKIDQYSFDRERCPPIVPK